MGIDVILVNPPSTRLKEFGLLSMGGAPRPPLNLMNLGASLLAKNYTVKIVDGTVENCFSRVLQEVISEKPRFIGITSMTAHIHTAGKLAAEFKKSLPSTPIIIGGIHVSTLPEETLSKYVDFDVGVIGEGDITIHELISCLESNKEKSSVSGIIFRQGQNLVRTKARPLIKDLDSLPLPAFSLLPKYTTVYQPTLSRKTRLPSAYIVTSRGCPFSCTFCNNIVHGHSFRTYSVPYLIKIIQNLIDEYKIKDLTIYDENLSLRKDRVLDFCDQLQKNRFDLTWSCDARVDSVDEKTLSRMYEAGCRSIWFGMESGNARVLKRYRKGITLPQIERGVKMTRNAGIKACGSFIIGGPLENRKTILDTIKFARKIELDFFVPFYYTPVPGTPDYLEIEKYGKANLSYEAATMTQPTFAPWGMTKGEIFFWYVFSLFAYYGRWNTVKSMLLKS